MVECQTKKQCILELDFLCDESKFELQVNNSGIIKRIIFLQKKHAVCRITLRNSSKTNKINSLRFVPLRRSFAVRRMLKRLSITPKYIRQEVTRRGCHFDDLLFRAYDRLFSTDKDALYQSWILRSETESFEHYTGDLSDEPEFMVFCAPGYKLVSGAKSAMVSLLKQYPHVKLVYPDEDTIDSIGRRSRPFFKPDWNPDLFLASDYISSCYVCRRSWYSENEKLFEKYGARSGLVCAVTGLKGDEVLHVAQILVHRVGDTSTLPLKSGEQRVRALSEVVPSLVSVEPENINRVAACRLKYALPNPEPLVSIIIPTRDSLELVKSCIRSLFDKTAYLCYEVLIIDNKSYHTDTVKWLREIEQDPRVRVFKYNEPFNFSAINNFGVRRAKGSIVALLNNDTEVISPGWLTEMVSHACRPEIGCVGAKLYYSNGQIQHAGIILSEHNIAMHGHRYFDGDADGYHGRLKLVQNYSAVTGACLVVRKDVYEQVGGLNEKHLAVAYNDVDFCLKVREAGYRNLWTPYAELYHHESMSRGSDDSPKQRRRLNKEAAYMRKRWGAELANDPCYNPNLTPLKEDFSLRVI